MKHWGHLDGEAAGLGVLRVEAALLPAHEDDVLRRHRCCCGSVCLPAADAVLRVCGARQVLLHALEGWEPAGMEVFDSILPTRLHALVHKQRDPAAAL